MEISFKVLEHYQELERITHWFKDNRLCREMSVVHNDLEHLLAFYKMYLLPMNTGDNNV